MPRPARNMMAAAELGLRLRDLRSDRTGRDGIEPTSKDIERFGWSHGKTVSSESIRRAHQGEVNPIGCNADLLLVLCAFYEVAPSALGRYAEQQLEASMALAYAIGGVPPNPPAGRDNGTGDLGITGSGWIADSPGKVIQLPRSDVSPGQQAA